MDKTKWEIYFHNSLGTKLYMQTGGSAVLCCQQKQESVLAGDVAPSIKVVAAVMDYTL